MNSFVANLLTWAKNSPAVQAGKKEIIADIEQSATNFLASVTKGAPDVVTQVEQQMAAAVATALAGAITKSR